MSFWHNPRYSELESQIGFGDSLRGFPAKRFPWEVHKVSLRDDQQDIWNLSVFCQHVETQEFSKMVKANMALEASCIVGGDSLRQMGIQNSRLLELDISNWNYISEKSTINIQCLLDKIEENSILISKKFFEKIRTKYTLEKKKDLISLQIRNCKISRFS